MKILFVINKLGGGGRERRMVQLVRELTKYHNIEMYATVFDDTIEYEEIHETSIKIYKIKHNNRLQQIHEYNRIIKKNRPDIIHLWIETPTECIILPILAKIYGSKFIAGFIADCNIVRSSLFSQYFSIKFAFHFADAIVSNSKAGLIAKNAPNIKSHIIYNGFDETRFANLNLDKIQEELVIKDKFIIFMCGRLNNAKNWDMFIKLAAMCHETNDNFYFIAAGNGEKLDLFKKEVFLRNLNNITFLGRRNDIESLILFSNVCVLFTNNENHAEGISNFIMESMAGGKPVIATEGGGTSEIIESLKDGFIISPNDIDKAYNIIEKLYNSPQFLSDIGNNARNKIKKQFQLRQMGEKYLKLYNQLIKG